jgi:hypothetical protein
MADLTRDDQSCGNGIAEGDDLVDIEKLPEGSLG